MVKNRALRNKCRCVYVLCEQGQDFKVFQILSQIKNGVLTERFEDTLAQCCPTQFQINFKFSNEELGKIKFNNIPHSIKFGQNSISMYSKRRIIFILPHTRQPQQTPMRRVSFPAAHVTKAQSEMDGTNKRKLECQRSEHQATPSRIGICE